MLQKQIKPALGTGRKLCKNCSQIIASNAAMCKHCKKPAISNPGISAARRAKREVAEQAAGAAGLPGVRGWFAQKGQSGSRAKSKTGQVKKLNRGDKDGNAGGKSSQRHQGERAQKPEDGKLLVISDGDRKAMMGLMRRKGIKQAELARRANVQARAVSDIVNGDRLQQPSKREAYAAIMRYFHAEVRSLGKRSSTGGKPRHRAAGAKHAGGAMVTKAAGREDGEDDDGDHEEEGAHDRKVNQRDHGCDTDDHGFHEGDFPEWREHATRGSVSGGVGMGGVAIKKGSRRKLFTPSPATARHIGSTSSRPSQQQGQPSTSSSSSLFSRSKLRGETRPERRQRSKAPRVLKLMQALGKSQAQVARESGIASARDLQRWLTGDRLNTPTVAEAGRRVAGWLVIHTPTTVSRRTPPQRPSRSCGPGDAGSDVTEEAAGRRAPGNGRGGIDVPLSSSTSSSDSDENDGGGGSGDVADRDDTATLTTSPLTTSPHLNPLTAAPARASAPTLLSPDSRLSPSESTCSGAATVASPATEMSCAVAMLTMAADHGLSHDGIPCGEQDETSPLVCSSKGGPGAGLKPQLPCELMAEARAVAAAEGSLGTGARVRCREHTTMRATAPCLMSDDGGGNSDNSGDGGGPACKRARTTLHTHARATPLAVTQPLAAAASPPPHGVLARGHVAAHHIGYGPPRARWKARACEGGVVVVDRPGTEEPEGAGHATGPSTWGRLTTTTATTTFPIVGAGHSESLHFTPLDPRPEYPVKRSLPLVGTVAADGSCDSSDERTTLKGTQCQLASRLAAATEAAVPSPSRTRGVAWGGHNNGDGLEHAGASKSAGSGMRAGHHTLPLCSLTFAAVAEPPPERPVSSSCSSSSSSSLADSSSRTVVVDCCPLGSSPAATPSVAVLSGADDIATALPVPMPTSLGGASDEGRQPRHRHAPPQQPRADVSEAPTRATADGAPGFAAVLAHALRGETNRASHTCGKAVPTVTMAGGSVCGKEYRGGTIGIASTTTTPGPMTGTLLVSSSLGFDRGVVSVERRAVTRKLTAPPLASPIASAESGDGVHDGAWYDVRQTPNLATGPVHTTTTGSIGTQHGTGITLGSTQSIGGEEVLPLQQKASAGGIVQIKEVYAPPLEHGFISPEGRMASFGYSTAGCDSLSFGGNPMVEGVLGKTNGGGAGGQRGSASLAMQAPTKQTQGLRACMWMGEGDGGGGGGDSGSGSDMLANLMDTTQGFQCASINAIATPSSFTD